MAKLPVDGGPKDGIADLRRRLEKLEKELKRQRSSSSFLQNAEIRRGGLTISGGGGISIKDGGGINVTDGGEVKLYAANGAVIFEVLSDRGNPDPDGNPQPRVVINREDGSACLLMDDPAPLEDGYHQFIRMWDRSGAEIFSEDATSGHGIANPWLTGTMFPARYTDWPKSTSGTFEEIWTSEQLAQNPTTTLGISHTSDDPDTTGEARFQINGTTIGDTAAIGFVVASELTASQLPLPGSVPMRSFYELTLQIRRTAGTGNVMAAPYLVSGSQT